MQSPEQTPQPVTPTPTPAPAPAYVQPAPVAAPARKSVRATVGLWLLIGPSVLMVGSFILFMIVNQVTGGNVYNADGGASVATTLNLFLIMIGGVGVVLFLPALIVGLILRTSGK